VGCLKYLLVIEDHLTIWVEAVPPSSTTINGAVRILLDNTIPQFGLTKNIDLGNRSHFAANIIRELVRH
jgi:hypothetical protein